MTRRYDQIYRVKPRDNLGDPEYWNRRFDDIDRRVSSTEDGIDAISGLTGYVEGLALNRLDQVLSPALDKISLVSEQGFLLAHSASSVTLDTATSQTFAIANEAERLLFSPSPFVTITRSANRTDYAFARTLSWDRVSGQLVLQPMQVYGNNGPFNDWVIYVGSAISDAVIQMLTQAQAARDAALTAKNAAAASAVQTGADQTSVTNLRNEVIGYKNQAAQSALNAQTWDPTSYAQISYVTTAVNTSVSTAITGLRDGVAAGLDTLAKLAAAVGNDAAFSTNITSSVNASLGNRIRFDAAQTLTAPQLLQAQANIGLTRTAAASEIWANSTDNVVTVSKAWSSANWVNLGNVTGAVAINGNNGSRFYATLTGAVTISFTNMKVGQSVELILSQDATGGRTVSWSGTNFPDGVVPTIQTAASNVAVIFSGVWTYGAWMSGVGWKIN